MTLRQMLKAPEFAYEIDIRNPPDEDRRRAFFGGWKAWSERRQPLAASTARSLTWWNTGHRVARLTKLTDDSDIDHWFWVLAQDYGSRVPGPKRKRGGGYSTDPEQNRAVERAAIRYVKNWYHRRGWTVDSVESDYCGYDLECHKGRAVEHVEVKGIGGTEEKFPITAGEVTNTKVDRHSIVCVVTSARSPRPRFSRYTGRDFCVCFSLEPTQYMAERRG